MADQPLESISAPSLGGISVSLGSAHSGRASSGGTSGSSDRNNQLVSLSLIDFIEPEVGEYETDPLTRTDEVTISDHVYERKSWLEQAAATVVVGFTTLTSGVLKVGEYVWDGATWVTGTVVAGGARLVGAEDFAVQVETATMDAIAQDRVGDLNESLYGENGILKDVNAASALKYDSELAKSMQNVTTKGVVLIGATAATIVTGGAATPVLFAAAALEGAGESGERHFQDTENRDYWSDSIDIGFDALATGLETIGTAKAGASLYNGIAALRQVGFGGLKEMGRRTLNNWGNATYRRIIKNGTTKVLKTAAVKTITSGETWGEVGAVLLPDIKNGIKTGDWDFEGMLAKTGGVLSSNYVGSLGAEYFTLSKMAGRTASAQTAAIEGFRADSWIAANVPEAEFNSKVDAAQAMAIKYDQDGVMTEEKFYTIWGTEKGQRPDPSTYLPQEYIESHLAQYQASGASRLSSTDDFVSHVGNTTGATIGRTNPYDIGGTPYTGGSEFMSVHSDVDVLLTSAQTTGDPYKSIAEGLGMQDMDKFNSGVYRYDIAPSELSGLHIRIPSGNEPGAYALEWIPGGHTLGGAPEAVVDVFQGNGSTITVKPIMGAKPKPVTPTLPKVN